MATATFSEHKHLYESEGKAVPSVTQVLALAGISDVSMIPAQILERARDIGTKVHLATELLDQDDLDWGSLDPSVVGYVSAYKLFRLEQSFIPDFIEHRGVSDHHGLRFGYCVDRIGFSGADEKRYAVLLDIKTSSRVHPSWRIQTAAYQDGTDFVGERQIVHLAKDGTYKLLVHDEPSDLNIWHSALEVAHWKLANGTKLRS